MEVSETVSEECLYSAGKSRQSLYIKRVLCGTRMAVILVGSCPPMVEVFGLGRECGPVYALLWESAFKDVSGKGKSAQGGTTSWSVKGIANQCGLGKATVIKALKKLLDAGFVQYAGWAWGNGSPKRRWRVTHPKHLEAVRYAISVMGKPSLKYGDRLVVRSSVDGECDEGVWLEDTL